MDDSCHPLYDLKAAEGVPNHVSIDTRKLLRDVLRSNASTAILAHNHPTGPAPVSYTHLTYAKGQINDNDNRVDVDKVNTLADVSALNADTNPATYTVHVTADGKILDALYVNGTMACFYDGAGYHAGLVSKNDGVEAPANNTITVATNAVDNPIDTEF